ncbi:hypothetical protein HDU89_001652 [Geranomyces variabilis]|nr:hypothetical protein HDU89_001652 [Geranomyces variabilis]
MSLPEWSEYLANAERELRSKFPKATAKEIVQKIATAAGQMPKSKSWPKKVGTKVVESSLASIHKRQAAAQKVKGAGLWSNNTTTSTTITASHSVVVLGNNATIAPSTPPKATPTPIVAITPIKPQATSLGLGPIGNLAIKTHNGIWACLHRFIVRNSAILDHNAHAGYAKVHKNESGKADLTAERRTWDLTDGLRFIQENIKRLVSSSGVTAFAGPKKENPK